MFAINWLLFRAPAPERTAIEKEQQNFLFFVEELCKYKILYIVYSQNKHYELPLFDADNKSKQGIETAFETMSEALKYDIKNMLIKEIEFANSIIVKKEFIFIKPISLENSMYLLYYSALFIHDSISQYSLNYDLFGRVTEIVEQLNQINSGWNVDYEVGELTLAEKASEAKIIQRESKKLRALIQAREAAEAQERVREEEKEQGPEKPKDRENILLEKAILRVKKIEHKLAQAQKELEQVKKKKSGLIRVK